MTSRTRIREAQDLRAAFEEWCDLNALPVLATEHAKLWHIANNATLALLAGSGTEREGVPVAWGVEEGGAYVGMIHNTEQDAMRDVSERKRVGSDRNLGRYSCTHRDGHCPHFSHPEGPRVAIVVCCHCGGTQRTFTARNTDTHGQYVPGRSGADGFALAAGAGGRDA